MCVIPADLRSHARRARCEHDYEPTLLRQSSVYPADSGFAEADSREAGTCEIGSARASPLDTTLIIDPRDRCGLISHWTPNAAIWTLYPASDLLLRALKVIMFEFLDKHEL